MLTINHPSAHTMKRDTLIAELLKLDSLKHIDADIFDSLPVDELARILALHTGEKPRQREPLVRGRLRFTNTRARAVPRYRAQVWEKGQNVLLGSFLTQSERDQVVASAKLRRSMGLPVKLV